MGVVFGHACCLVEELAPGSFAGAEFEAGRGDSGQVHALLTYFSFVTLTTVGYGDITPTIGLGRGLAMVEAVLGQFYLAVLVAVLIGKTVLAIEPRSLGGWESVQRESPHGTPAMIEIVSGVLRLSLMF